MKIMRGYDTDNKVRIRASILLPFSLAILILLIAATFSIYWLQKRNITQEVRSRITAVQTLFQENIEKDSLLISGLIDFLKKDKNLQQAWLAKDRDTLLQYVTPLFEDLRSKYRVTHFYFHGLDKPLPYRRVLLR